VFCGWSDGEEREEEEGEERFSFQEEKGVLRDGNDKS
jgi:hypothetical protein